METLHEEGRIHYPLNGRPTIKRFLAEIAEVEESESTASGVDLIVRCSMRAIAHRLALCPREIHDVEWRDMERILREVFESLGFATELTRGAKDGGFDLRLSAAGLSYLVEVKHWSPGNLVGGGVVSRFAEVVVTEKAERGLLVSSSGFTRKVLSGRIELEQHAVALGNDFKIISLCRAYLRANSNIWVPSIALPEILFADTL